MILSETLEARMNQMVAFRLLMQKKVNALDAVPSLALKPCGCSRLLAAFSPVSRLVSQLGPCERSGV
jgi:hypothetical protein